MLHLIAFIIAFSLCLYATKKVMRFSISHNILDMPEGAGERKRHKNPTPLLGGLAIIFSFIITSAAFYFIFPVLHNNIPFQDLAAIWLAGAVLGLGGYIDDKHNLAPLKQLIFPLLAALIIAGAGIGIPHITNPVGGKIELAGIVSVLFVIFWILGMIYTTKLLDGLDGLAGGVGVIGALTIFALSFMPQVMQPYTALLAIIAAGAMAGFLIYNWHPAKIFLGEAGSTFVGFILGVLAIISGGKIATAFLVMGVAILDVLWVIWRRLRTRQSIFKGDRNHLHYRLIDLGLSQPQVVSMLLFLSAVFGSVAVLSQTFGKLLELGALILVMIIIGSTIFVLNRRRIEKALEHQGLD